MIGGEVVVTYKRKRPSLRANLSCENELLHKSVSAISDNSTTSNKPEESTEDLKSKNQRKDSEVCFELSVGGNDSNLVQSDCCHNPFHVQCIDSMEDDREAKSLCSEKYNMKEIALASCSQLEKTPMDNDCEKSSGGAFTKDSYAEEKSVENQGGPRLCISSSSDLEHKYTEIKLAASSAPEAGGSEGTDSPLKDKPHSSCVNAIGEKKLTLPLITFRRRSKRVKDVNGPDRESNLQGDCSAVEALPSGTCSMNLLVNDTYSVGNVDTCHIAGAQENKSSQNVDCTRAPAGSAPKNNAATQEAEQVFSDSPPIAEAVVKTEQPSLSLGEGSEIPPIHRLNTTKVPDGIGSEGCSVASGAISIPPSDSRFVVDCNIALESNSDEQPIHNISQDCNNLNLSTEGNAEHPSSNKEQPTVQECLSVNPIGNQCNNLVELSPTFTGMISKNNYLQLFPEDRSNDTPPMGKAQQKAINCKDFEERNGCDTESWSTPKPPSKRSSLFLGRSLPTEPAAEVYANNPTSSQWPNVGFHSKDFIQDNQTSSLLRHQMMLDNIVSRARAVERNRIEFPNLWLEEELDSLWVGVRRHGKGNWESMLRDPRLQFLSWRTPLDLADKWQEEIRKLLNSMPVSDMNCLRTSELLLLDRLNGLFRNKTGKEIPVDDFQLSLGEVYSQPTDSFPNQTMFKHDMHYQLQRPVSNSGAYSSSSCPRKGSHTFNKALLASKSSPNADSTTRGSLGGSGNLPHWLKEAVSIPPMSHDPSLLSLAPSITCSSTQCLNQPHLQSNGGACETSRTEQHMDGRACGDFSQVKRRGKNESCQFDVDEQKNLIIIDSDASSEETISDDLSVRP